jgi:hypothetical protein
MKIGLFSSGNLHASKLKINCLATKRMVSQCRLHEGSRFESKFKEWVGPYMKESKRVGSKTLFQTEQHVFISWKHDILWKM